MGKSEWRKVLSAGSFLLLIVLIAAVYCLRKESYQLNKNVRLVFLRILKYGELSLHRGYTYRIRFNRDDYRISALPPGPNGEWREVVTYPYEDSVEAGTPGLTIIFRDGELVSYYVDEKRDKLRSFLILNFFDKKHPSKTRGIMFEQSGLWRAL